ncbi:MAG: T9SS type A sorting domain-containing protein [Bacteroidetes bacterium]|nr:T9SS type A sorting domain-containing protein [Bacteroidota bacterium]
MKVIHKIFFLLSLTVSFSTIGGTVAASSIQDNDYQSNSASRSQTLTLVVSSINPKCFGEYTGSANVNIMGGVPPFTTTWMPGGMTATTVTGLCAGNYSVRVKDSTGTIVMVNVQLTAPPAINVTAAMISPACTEIATVKVGANGGTLPYTGTGNFLTPAGNFVYSVTDSRGCKATDSMNVVTFIPPTVSITADTTTLCAGSIINICATATSGTSLLWNTGEVSNCIETGNAGNYYLVATDANNCSTESNRFEVKVHSAPIVSVMMYGDTLKAGKATGYQWYHNNQEIASSNQNVHVARTVGSYNVAVTDQNGCTARSADVYVSSISNNVATGIGELNEDGLVVRSNPSVNGNWALSAITDLMGGTIEVMDNNGRLVYSSVITNSNISLDLNASKGVYLLHIRSGNQDITRKLIRL